MSVTIKTIAESTGLSISTVSRALAETGRIKQSTRETVLQAAKRLGYTPNAAAKALITGRSRSIGLVVPTVTNPFFTAVLKGAQARARSLGYILIVADSDENPAVERALVAEFAARTEGVIVGVVPSATADADAESYASLGPMITINRQSDGISSACIDISAGARQAMEHLAAQGHRRIAYLGGSEYSWMNNIQRASFAEEANVAGMEFREFGPYTTDAEGGASALEPVLAGKFTAAIAFNDLMAMGLIGRLMAKGFHCPDDLSVIGVDDIPYASMSYPPLTTIRVNPDRLGMAAVDALVASFDAVDASLHRSLLDTQLVVRSSTGAVPA